jgi:DNA-binding beta-propeller fold protein YncE
MRPAISAFIILLMSPAATAPALAAADGPYTVLRTVTVGGDGGFDYLTADSAARRLYVARGGKVNPRLTVFDLDTLKQIGEIAGVGAHGTVVDAASGHGFLSSNPVTMFDAKTLQVLAKIPVDGSPDGMTADPQAGVVYVMSHKSPSVTAINAATGVVTGTADISGAPEESVIDGKGHLYITVEDGAAVAVLDTKTMKEVGRYGFNGKGGIPSGMTLDKKGRVLFVACRDPAVMLMLNADTGAILDSIPIGLANDGMAINPATHEVFASQGDGTLTIVKEISPTRFKLEQTVATVSSAKTLTLDSKTGHIFLMAADYAPPPDAVPLSAGRIARGPVIPGSFKLIEVGKP